METKSGTSNIAELPYNNVPLNTVESGNMVIDNKIQNEINNREQMLTSETQTQVQTQVQSQVQSLNNQNQQINYNSMINDLQKASQSGMTTLPSRDIPMNTNTIVQDEQIKPNYIPENTIDYINDNININTNTNINNNNINKLDEFYNNLQTPILLSILYFIFQLPIFQKYLIKYLPNLFGKDGNKNIYGYIFYSILFGITYIGINQLIIKLNDI